MSEGRDYIQLAASYQAGVLDGSIPACVGVRLACERNRRDLDRQETDGFPYRFDPDVAVRICVMAEMLPHVKGPLAKVIGRDDAGRTVWNPIVLEPWQCWIFTTMFGWVHASTGARRVDLQTSLRRFRVALILVPRKNTKSTMGAIIVLYMLTADGEGGPECYSAATTRDQAKAVAEIVWEMAKRSPAFCEFYGVRVGSETSRSLAVPANAGKFMPLSADANSLDGLNISLAVVDELHAHKTPAVWHVLDTGTGARLQPYIVAITTAGVDVGGICHQKMGYLEKVLDGVAIDETFFGVNYTIDQGDEDNLADERVQRKANPNWGVSVQPADLARKVAETRHSTAELNNVLTKHFNVWIRTESSWMSATLWQTCKKLGLTLEQLKAFPCWIGVDLAEVRDIAAVMLLFKLAPDAYAAIGRFYLPEATIDKSPTAEMSGWVRDKWLISTAGDQTDFQRIEDDLIKDCDTFNVQSIDFDRALASQMQQGLMRRLEPRMGQDAVEKFVLTVKQDSVTMDGAMKMAERLVLGKKIEHDGNPAMAWMVSNVVAKRNDVTDEIHPRKAGGKDSANKIDGPVALFTCLSVAMHAVEAPSTVEAEWL